MEEFLQLAKGLFPYLPDEVINKYVDYYAESDRNIDVALGKLRQDPIYDDYFPGNKRADRTVRYNEAEYLAVKKSYKLSLEDYGLNPELFDDTFSNLIAGDVSPSEFKGRIDVVFEGIKSNIPQVKEFYSANYGIDLTDEAIFASAIKPELGDMFDDNTIFQVNPTGNFVTGGPDGDTGVTGRKIIVDTYGGYAPHGGGAFSGKDCTKVDRSGAYMARYLAKNIVASGVSQNATIQLSYAIGVKEPVSLYVYCDGKVRNDISEWIYQNVDLTPLGIIRKFNLFKLDLTETTNYGHFGKNHLAWEKTDIANQLNF